MLICDNVGSHCQHLLSANYLGRGQKAAQRHQKMASLGPGNVGELWLTKAATNIDCKWVSAVANFWNISLWNLFCSKMSCDKYHEYQHETLIWLQTFKSLEELHPHN